MVYFMSKSALDQREWKNIIYLQFTTPYNKKLTSSNDFKILILTLVFKKAKLIFS